MQVFFLFLQIFMHKWIEKVNAALKQKEIAKRQLEEAKQRLDYMEKKAKLYRKIIENHIPDSTNPAKWPVKSAQ